MTMAAECAVTYELRDGVAWLGLNRPHKRNAIGEALLAGLEAALRRAQDEARALVIFGHGPCFSAGVDLKELRARQPAQVFHGSRAWHAAFSHAGEFRGDIWGKAHGESGAAQNRPGASARGPRCVFSLARDSA
jgi:enoyl-CoA hydratase/carnithine racemase